MFGRLFEAKQISIIRFRTQATSTSISTNCAISLGYILYEHSFLWVISRANNSLGTS